MLSNQLTSIGEALDLLKRIEVMEANEGFKQPYYQAPQNNPNARRQNQTSPQDQRAGRRFDVREIEQVTANTHAEKELILLHHEDTGRPRDTISWLDQMPWLSRHKHIRCREKIFSRIDDSHEQDSTSDASIHPDIYRLARWLAGISVGLVLGGGGAKGAAHIGMLQAIEVLGSNKISWI
jgi:hypothetical protein